MNLRALIHLNLALAVMLSLACRSVEPIADQAIDPVGQQFPSVTGAALNGTEWTVPEDMLGEPTLLLVGYLQNAQFDIDRWLVGLFQIDASVKVYEIPTIEGMVPSLFAGYIDDGMRSGIPEEDWGAVITVYGDADKIVDTIGRENRTNAQVVLLDENGVIRWFHNRGFSPAKLMEMAQVVREISVD